MQLRKSLIKRRLETAASRKKSYADPKRRDIEFQVGDYVFLNVSSPMKGVMIYLAREKVSTEIHWTIRDTGES